MYNKIKLTFKATIISVARDQNIEQVLKLKFEQVFPTLKNLILKLNWTLTSRILNEPKTLDPNQIKSLDVVGCATGLPITCQLLTTDTKKSKARIA